MAEPRTPAKRDQPRGGVRGSRPLTSPAAHRDRSRCPRRCPRSPGPAIPPELQKMRRTSPPRDPGGRDAATPHSCSVASGNSLCWKHNRQVNVYCHTDGRMVCAGCASAEHGGHTIGLVAEERRRRQEELKRMKAKSKKALREGERQRALMEAKLEQIEEAARQAADDCEGVIVGIIDSIQRRYLSVRELIRAREEAAAARVRLGLQALQLQMEDVRRRDAELDRLARVDSDIRFLQEWPSLELISEEDHPSHEAPGDPPLLFQSIKTSVEQLARQLEAFCDNGFASISQTADGGGGQESGEETEEENEAALSQLHGVSGVISPLTVEPTSRAEFLQYACELTLDPATAHEDLLLIDDKEVMLHTQRCTRPAVRCPDRFVHRRQVLCREGLQAERCYYEVEVYGNKAEIALAYKAMDRKSRTSLSAFGGSANSWSLDRSSVYSVSHKGDSVQLTTHPTHHRIGVYIKFREGTLSFYEVSERMTFLYEVEAKFTEPLYPGFWLGDRCRIAICDLRQENVLSG